MLSILSILIVRMPEYQLVIFPEKENSLKIVYFINLFNLSIISSFLMCLLLMLSAIIVNAASKISSFMCSATASYIRSDMKPAFGDMVFLSMI